MFCNAFILLGCANGVEDFRVGITVTKKVGNAVVRNYCKRRMKVIARSIACNFYSGMDYIFVIKKNFIFEDFSKLLCSCEKNIGILNKKAHARFSEGTR